jgi:hypothetical protein
VIVGIGFRSLVAVVVVYVGCGFIQRVRLCRKPPRGQMSDRVPVRALTGIVYGKEFDL